MSQRLVEITGDASYFSLMHDLIEAEKSFARDHCIKADVRCVSYEGWLKEQAAGEAAGG